MDLQRVRVPGAGNGRVAFCWWLACAVVSMAICPLLVGCAESGTPTAGLEVVDGTAGRVDSRSGPATTESLNGAPEQGTEGASADDTGGGDAPTNGAQDGASRPEVETDDEAGMNEAAEVNEAAEAKDDAEARDDTGEEKAVDVTLSPEAGSGAEVPAPGSPDAPNEPDPAEAPPEPVSLVEADVLPAVQPVTGTDVKLDGVLLELVRALRTGGEAGLLAYAAQHQPGLSVDRLRVEIVCDSSDAAAAVREQVTAAGGTVTTSFENYVWAEIPLDKVEGLAVSEAVWTIGVTQSLMQPGVR